MKALGNQTPSSFEPPAGWPKDYTNDGLRQHFPSAVTAWKYNVTQSSLIVVISLDSPKLEKDHFLNKLHLGPALKRYSLGQSKEIKQFTYCLYCGDWSENQESAYSHVRRHLDYTCSYIQMDKHLDEC